MRVLRCALMGSLAILAACVATQGVARDGRDGRDGGDWRRHDGRRVEPPRPADRTWQRGPRYENRHGDAGHHRHDWRAGYWHSGWRGGRWGWWWVVGPSWYYYRAPIYPFPGPYVSPVVVPALTTVYVERPQDDAPAPADGYWYWCEPARAYYPHVASCSTAWRRVPAVPPAPD
jgi:hypothetical protein